MSKGEKFQIGWYNLEKDEVFRNTYSYAAWYEDVLVKAGKYPVYAREYNFNERLRKYTSELKDFGNIVVVLPGEVVGDDFSSHYGGVAVTSKVDQGVGKKSEYMYHPYAHSLAHSILEGKSRIELIAPFEAKYVHFISSIDNRECTTAKVYNTEMEESE
jgi:hypothetical protein